jgi:hypothetical protein
VILITATLKNTGLKQAVMHRQNALADAAESQLTNLKLLLIAALGDL